jgi:hypothetical protein
VLALIKRLLKRFGFLPMTDKEYEELIPSDSLSGLEISQLVVDMKDGESRNFKFNPMDEGFSDGPEMYVTMLCFSTGRTLYGSWDIQPRRGKYILKIHVL